MRHPCRVAITPASIASRSAMKGGWAMRRWRSQNSPSLVNRPLPSVMRSLS
jgi:hypothetical protein